LEEKHKKYRENPFEADESGSVGFDLLDQVLLVDSLQSLENQGNQHDQHWSVDSLVIQIMIGYKTCNDDYDYP
jgi:hypothetical protein